MKASGRSKTHDGLQLILTFDYKEPFTCVVSPLLDRVVSFFCPCHDYSLEVGEKDWLFTLFLLLAVTSGLRTIYLLSQEMQRRLADCKFLN